MINNVPQSRPRHSGRQTQRVQEQLISDATPSPPRESLPRDSPATSVKRRLDEVDQPPANKVRLSSAHQVEGEDQKAQHQDQVRQHTPSLELTANCRAWADAGSPAFKTSASTPLLARQIRRPLPASTSRSFEPRLYF